MPKKLSFGRKCQLGLTQNCVQFMDVTGKFSFSSQTPVCQNRRWTQPDSNVVGFILSAPVLAALHLARL
jgi:hypothetical protein